jgi:hypothetical protein
MFERYKAAMKIAALRINFPSYLRLASFQTLTEYPEDYWSWQFVEINGGKRRGQAQIDTLSLNLRIYGSGPFFRTKYLWMRSKEVVYRNWERATRLFKYLSKLYRCLYK